MKSGQTVKTARFSHAMAWPELAQASRAGPRPALLTERNYRSSAAWRQQEVNPLEGLLPRFSGQTVIVAATGPSLPEIWNGHKSNLPKIVISDAWQIIEDADILYSCDVGWWEHHWNDVQDYPGLKVGYDPTIRGVYPLVGSGETGFDPELGKVRHGFNSGCQATHLAAQLGASRIVLIGFDMNDTNGQHFFGEHPERIRTAQFFDMYIAKFRPLALALAKRGIEVLNCTPGSSLKWFETADLDDILVH